MEEIRKKKKKKHLRKQMRTAPPTEIEGLKQLWNDLKAQHSALSKAERLRWRKQAKRKEQERFYRDPFQYARPTQKRNTAGRERNS